MLPLLLGNGQERLSPRDLSQQGFTTIPFQLYHFTTFPNHEDLSGHFLFSLFALASGSLASDTEHAFEARQTYGSCRVTGKRERLDVHFYRQRLSAFHGVYAVLTSSTELPSLLTHQDRRHGRQRSWLSPW